MGRALSNRRHRLDIINITRAPFKNQNKNPILPRKEVWDRKNNFCGATQIDENSSALPAQSCGPRR